MTKRIYLMFLAFALMLTQVLAAMGQGAAATAPAQTSAGLLALLPASDAVLFLEVQQVLNDALPGTLGQDQARLAQINTQIDNFRTRTGVDLRAVERLAGGVRFVSPSPRVTRMESVVLARGRFDTNAIVAAGRATAAGRFREETHQGTRIYIFNLNERMRLFGLFSFNLGEVGIASLNANTLALGSPATVRTAIDAHAGRGGRVNAELISLATRNASALVGFSGNVPASAMSDMPLGEGDLGRDLAAIRQLYGSIGTTSAGYDLNAFLRTGTAAQAASLGQTISAMKAVGISIVGQALGARGRLAQTALEKVAVTPQNNEVQIKLELSQSEVTALIGGQ